MAFLTMSIGSRAPVDSTMKMNLSSSSSTSTDLSYLYLSFGLQFLLSTDFLTFKVLVYLRHSKQRLQSSTFSISTV